MIDFVFRCEATPAHGYWKEGDLIGYAPGHPLNTVTVLHGRSYSAGHSCLLWEDVVAGRTRMIGRSPRGEAVMGRNVGHPIEAETDAEAIRALLDSLEGESRG